MITIYNSEINNIYIYITMTITIYNNDNDDFSKSGTTVNTHGREPGRSSAAGVLLHEHAKSLPALDYPNLP